MPSPMLQEAHRLCLVNLMIMDNKTTWVRCSHMISMIYNTCRELLACLKNNLKFYYKKIFPLITKWFPAMATCTYFWTIWFQCALKWTKADKNTVTVLNYLHTLVFLFICLKASLHEGGGPQVGEVTCLAVVEK